MTNVSHIALFFPDLQEAERYYMDLFDMELIGREMMQADGHFSTLPFDKDWEDVQAAGLDLHMVALQKGKFVLALFKGDIAPGQVYVIGLNMPSEDIELVFQRLETDQRAADFQEDRLEFIDPYQITWQLGVEPVFRTAGDFADRWISF